MTNVEIKVLAGEKIERNFDSLLLFSVFASVIKALGKSIPVVGSALLSPIELSLYDVFSNASKYKKVSINEFKKYFKKQWHSSFAYTARSYFYTYNFLVIVLVITLLFPLAIIITGFLIAIGLFVAIARGLSCEMGEYILYKNPSMSSRDALKMSIDMMDGNRFRYLGLCIRLIPQAIQCVLLGYGLPCINESFLLFFEDIYDSYGYVGEIEADLEVCPKCGEIREVDANFCGKCGYNFNNEEENSNK